MDDFKKNIELFLLNNIYNILKNGEDINNLTETFKNFKDQNNLDCYLMTMQIFKNKKAKMLYLSDEYYRITGLDNYHKDGEDIWHHYLSPDSQKSYIEAIRNVKDKPNEVNFTKLKFKNNNISFVLLSASVIFKIDAKTFFAGLFLKTDKKHPTTSVNHSKKSVTTTNFSKTLFLKLPVSVVITNVIGQIIYVNPFFEKLTLYSKNEVLNKNPRFLKSGKTPKAVFKDMWNNISNGKSWEGYFINVKKNKNIYYEKAVVFPLISSKGEITRYIALKTDITNEVKSKAKINKNYSIFQTIFNKTNIAYCIIDSCTYLKAYNSNFISLFIVDNIINEEKNINKLKFYDNQAFKKYIERVNKTGRHQEQLFVSHLKIWIEVYLEKISENSILLTTKDITYLKKTEQKLVLRSNQLANLINIIDVAIFSINLDGKIKDLNEKAKKISENCNLKLGDNLLDYFVDEDDNKNVSMGEILINNTNQKECFFKRTKGKKIKVSVSTTFTYNKNSKDDFILCVVHDISKSYYEKELLEQKVAEKTKELQYALSKEKELNVLKSDFVSKTSHEFRTPLATISITSEFIKKYKNKLKPEKFEEKLDKIIEQTQKMTALLDDFLMIEKFNSQRIIFNPEKIELNNFVERIVVQHQEINKDFNLNFTKSEKTYVLLDERLGTSIFQNLISNAIKYSKDRKDIEINIENNIENVKIAITDYGIGIPDDFKNKIFGTFVRAENAAALDGTGLGLSIVKSSVEMHNGKISFSSQQNKGTTFIVILPCLTKN